MESLNLPAFIGFLSVRTHEIIRAEAVNNYTKFYFAKGKEIMVARTLKHFEQILVHNGFFRIHKSHLINLKHVAEYVHNKTWEVVMKDNSHVPISRRKQRSFFALVEEELTVP